MATLFDLFDDIGQLAFEPRCQPDAEDRADLVRRQPPKPQLAAAFEDLMDGKMALEDEIAAVLNLGNGVETRQADLLAFAGRELGAEVKRPVVEPFPNQFRTQAVGGGLQGGNVVYRQERIVLFLEPGA